MSKKNSFEVAMAAYDKQSKLKDQIEAFIVCIKCANNRKQILMLKEADDEMGFSEWKWVSDPLYKKMLRIWRNELRKAKTVEQKLTLYFDNVFTGVGPADDECLDPCTAKRYLLLCATAQEVEWVYLCSYPHLHKLTSEILARWAKLVVNDDEKKKYMDAKKRFLNSERREELRMQERSCGDSFLHWIQKSQH